MKFIVIISLYICVFMAGSSPVLSSPSSTNDYRAYSAEPCEYKKYRNSDSCIKTASYHHMTKEAKTIALAQALYHHYKTNYQEVFVLDYMASFNHQGVPVPYGEFRLTDVFELTSKIPGVIKSVLIFEHVDYVYSLAIITPKVSKNNFSRGKSLFTLMTCGGIYAKSFTGRRSIYQIMSIPCGM